jgi:N-acetylglucosaminyl-diphospho-decaprenol L-rhamnosyltransferase
MTPAAIDVVIVNHNTQHDVLACLSSLFAAPPASLGRVFVVDNASTDASVAAIRSDWPAVDVIALDRNLGFGAANNVALRRAASPLVLLLNPDTVMSKGALDQLAGRMAATGAAAAGPRLVDGNGRPEISFGSMLSPWTELRQSIRVKLAARDAGFSRSYIRGLVSTERIVDWVSGACLLVRRDAALAAGLFDERYFLYEEDVDFCAALRARGGRILFTPAAEVVHLRGRSSSDRSHYHRSHLAFYAKHAPLWVPLLRLWQKVGSGLT